MEFTIHTDDVLRESIVVSDTDESGAIFVYDESGALTAKFTRGTVVDDEGYVEVFGADGQPVPDAAPTWRVAYHPAAE